MQTSSSPMTQPLLYAIKDLPTHPDFSALYGRLGFEELRLPSQRKAIAELKRRPPDWVVAEFVYGFHTYYQATNISNLDVFLQSLVKYAPAAWVVVIADRQDLAHAEPLKAIHPRLILLARPVSEGQMAEALGG
jgi:hypothetical protein